MLIARGKQPDLKFYQIKEPEEVAAASREKGIKIVDLKFTDLLGQLQHVSIPAERAEEAFLYGKGFDGSSIRGFQEIHESDMMLFPDPRTAFVDPFFEVPTLSVLCDIRDPITQERYTRDPRYVAQKAEEYLVTTGMADTGFWSFEPEFFIFDDVKYDQNEHSGYYFVESHEGFWNTGREEGPNLAYKPHYKGGYFPAPLLTLCRTSGPK